MRTRPDEERKDTILDAAKACFVERGFASTRMDDVALRAGLSKGGLYFHFPSKDALVEAVVARENAQLEMLLGQLAAVEGPLRLRVGTILRGLFAYARNNVDAARLSMSVLDEAQRNEALAHLVRRGEASFLGFLERLLAVAGEQGERPASASPGTAARILLIAVEGAKTKLVHFPDWPWNDIVAEIENVVLAALFPDRSPER